MVNGIEARLRFLEKTVLNLHSQVARVRDFVFGKKDEAPKIRKPRKPREKKALGAGPGKDPLDPHGIGALPATDPRYGDAPVNQKKKRGRKAAEAEAKPPAEEG